MTEYDFSPEAVEAHIRKQYQIANWVDNTNRQPLRNPFTPATPAVQALQLRDQYPEGNDYTDAQRHRRRDSKDHHDRHRERDRGDRQSTRDRERERDRDRDGTSSRHRPSISSSSRPHTKRNRSASQSATTVRPEPARKFSVPQPLQLPPQHNHYQSSSQQSSPTRVSPHYPYPSKMTSPRDSRDSSHSSATVPQPTYYPHQQVPHSAPIPRPSRMQTMPPNYAYPIDSKYPYTAHQPQAVAFPNAYTGYPGKQQHFDVANAPQYPHSMYQTKPPPLLKRLFMGLTGGNKHAQPKVPRRKRSSSF